MTIASWPAIGGQAAVLLANDRGRTSLGDYETDHIGRSLINTPRQASHAALGN
jgi:hypothetical protein